MEFNKFDKINKYMFSFSILFDLLFVGMAIVYLCKNVANWILFVFGGFIVSFKIIYLIIYLYYSTHLKLSNKQEKKFEKTQDNNYENKKTKENIDGQEYKENTILKDKQQSKEFSNDELFLLWCGQNTNKVYRLDSFLNIMKKILHCVLVVVVEIAICLLLNLWKSSYDYLDTNQAIPIIVMSITFFFAIGMIAVIIKDEDMHLYKDYSSIVLHKNIEKYIINHELPVDYNSKSLFVKLLKMLHNYKNADLTVISYKHCKTEIIENTQVEEKSKISKMDSFNVKENDKNDVEVKTEIPLSSKRLETQEKETCVANNKNVSNRSCGYASIDEIKAGLENIFNKLSGDFSGAKMAILKEVENGDANAMLNLGNIYLNGSGVELDKKKAYYYYRIAAYMGFASAIGYVGNYYLDEEENLYKSLVWHSIAAKKKNAYAAVRAWQTLCKLSVIENNMYYSNLSDILASKAMEFGYPLKQKVPAYQPMNFPYSKEEKEVFIKKFNDALKVVKQESKKEKEQIFNDCEIPEIVKNKIKAIDIFEQNNSKVIIVEEPILGTPLKQSVKYLCEDSEVCVGDLMYFHYLDYIPEPVKIISVLDTKLSKTEREKLYSANYIAWLSSNDNSAKKLGLDDYNMLGSLINYYKNEFNEKLCKEFDKKLQNIKLSSINFEKLKKDSNDIYKLTEQQDREQNIIIQELCVPLKRAGYLDSANKVYKYIYKTYGFSQTLMNSWAKIFVCNKQFDIAYKLFELGDNQYKYRIKTGDLKPDPITTILFGGVITSQCYENMKKAERAMNDYQYALQLVKDMGGKPDINNTNKLE